MVKYILFVLLLFSLAPTFGNITVKGTDLKVSNGANLIVKGNIELGEANNEQGIINSDSDLELTGNLYFNNSNTFGLELSTSSKIIFSGARAQKLLGTYSDTFTSRTISLTNSSELNSGDFYLDILTLNLTNANNLLMLGSVDAEIENIEGEGFVKATKEGSLILESIMGKDLSIPLSDGNSNFSLVFNQSAVASERISVRLIDIEFDSFLKPTLNFWKIDASDNLNARVDFRLDKSILEGQSITYKPSIRFFDGTKYVLFPEDDVSYSDEDDHYIISLSNINRFNYDD